MSGMQAGILITLRITQVPEHKMRLETPTPVLFEFNCLLQQQISACMGQVISTNEDEGKSTEYR